MWELRKNLTHGRLSVRRISVLATAFMMAFFVAILATANVALAADATRNGSTLSYNGQTYAEITTPSQTLPNGLPSDTTGYFYVDATANKTYFILTTGDVKKATQGQYVFYDGIPPQNFSNPSPPQSVSIANGGPNSLESTSGSTNTCDGSLTDGIGWILCPVVNFLASGMDHLYDILSSFLEVRPVQSDTSSSLYRMWAIVRDIANICFVIAFLIIVYSQVTSIGVSNYNVKRMLPRLIVAAILVNVSFWISALAVDLSNFLGHAIHDLFVNVFKSLNTAGQYKDIEMLSWESISTAILSGGTAIAGLGLYGQFVVLGLGLKGSLLLLIPILIGVLFAVLVALLVMAARQALITCLIIISPLAFVAFLLPNTEKYFDKWKDLFMTMLLLYPIFSVIFGASQLAGLAIIQNANSLNLIILGMAVMVAPVVITPLLVKFSGSLVGRIANMVNNPSRGVLDRTKNWAQGRAQEEKAKILAGQARNNWANRRTIAVDRRRRRKDGWKKAYETMADNNFAATGEGMEIEGATRRAANDRVRIDNAFARTAMGRQVEYQSRLYNLDKQRVENEFNESHEGHSVDRTHRVVEMDKKRIEGDHETNWNNEVRTNPELLQQSMRARSSEVRAELSKNRLEKINTEIAAQGSDNEYILNLRNVDQQTQAGMLNIAKDIKDNTFDSYLESSAKSMADRKIAINRAGTLKADNATGEAFRRAASGIMADSGGMESIKAQARREASKFVIDDVQNIESTLNNEFATNVDWLLTKLKSQQITFSERVAYSNLLAKAGGPGVGNLKKAIAHYDQQLINQNVDLETYEELQDYKDFMRGNGQFMGAGKDLEFWATNNRDNVTNAVKAFDDITKSRDTWSNTSAENITSFNVASQFRMFTVLYNTNRPLYDELMGALHDNGNLLYNKLKPGIRQKIAAVEAGTDTWGNIPSNLFDA